MGENCSGIKRFIAAVALLGVTASVGDYINFNQHVTNRIFRRGANSSVSRTVSQLELEAQKHPIEASRHKNKIIASALSLEGELNKDNYATIQSVVEEKVTQNPVGYEDFTTNVAKALVKKGSAGARKNLYNSYPKDEKIELSVETIQEMITYMRRNKMFGSLPEKGKDHISETKTELKAKEIIKDAKKNAGKIKNEIIVKSIELGDWAKEKYQDYREKYQKE